jgi:hypothetical protein
MHHYNFDTMYYQSHLQFHTILKYREVQPTLFFFTLTDHYLHPILTPF